MSQFAKIFEAVKTKESENVKKEQSTSVLTKPKKLFARDNHTKNGLVVSKPEGSTTKPERGITSVGKNKTANADKNLLIEKKIIKAKEEIVGRELEIIESEKYLDEVAVDDSDSAKHNLKNKLRYATARRELPKNVKPVGKSRHPDYTQALAYIKKDTHRTIKKMLIDDPIKRNLSDLIEELLTNWIKSTKKS